MTPFRSPDGTPWGVEVRMPTHSGALVIFHHPTGETARLNRYAWINAQGATDPGTRLASKGLTDALSERELALEGRSVQLLPPLGHSIRLVSSTEATLRPESFTSSVVPSPNSPANLS